MRRKFRGRAVPQKETAMDPKPVRFPGSYDERDRIRETHHVRINRLELGLVWIHGTHIQYRSVRSTMMMGPWQTPKGYA
jgi:hypothetical protein